MKLRRNRTLPRPITLLTLLAPEVKLEVVLRGLRAVLVVAAGCGAPAGAKICASDTDCPGGSCHAIGPGVSYCTFPDDTCASGERFGPQSGGLSNACVGGDRPDGGV